MKGVIFIAVFSLFFLSVTVADASRMRAKSRFTIDHSESHLPSAPLMESDEPVRDPVSLPKRMTVVKSDDPVEEVVPVPLRPVPIPIPKLEPVEDAPLHHQEEEPAQIISSVVDHHPKQTPPAEADHPKETHQTIAEDAPKKESLTETDDHSKEHDDHSKEHQHDTSPTVGRSLFKLESPAGSTVSFL